MKDMLIIFAKIAVGMLIAGIIIAFGQKINTKADSSMKKLDEWNIDIAQTKVVEVYEGKVSA